MFEEDLYKILDVKIKAYLKSILNFFLLVSMTFEQREGFLI
jgi:hypothetical protein